MSFDAELGAINYVVVTFGSTPIPTGGLDQVLSLVESGRILVLDAEFVTKGVDGAVATVDATEVGAVAFDGASAGLIDDSDLALVADSVPPGGAAIVLVYEDLTLLPATRAWLDEGGTIVAEGPIVVDELIEAIDASEQR